MTEKGEGGGHVGSRAMHVRHSKCVVIVNRSHGGLESNVPDTLVKSPQLKPDRLEASLDPGGGSETTEGGFPLTLKLRGWEGYCEPSALEGQLAWLY